MKARMFFVITMDAFKLVQLFLVFSVFLTASFVAGFSFGKSAQDKSKSHQPGEPVSVTPTVAVAPTIPESHFLETSTQTDEEEEKRANSTILTKEAKFVYALEIDGFPSRKLAKDSIEKWRKGAPNLASGARVFQKKGVYQIRVTLSENRKEVENLKNSLPAELFKRSKILSLPSNT